MTDETKTTELHSWEYPVVGYDSDNPPYGKILNNIFNSLDKEIPVIDVLANRPEAGTEGRRYYAIDEKVLYYDNGTTWKAIGGTGKTASSQEFSTFAESSIAISHNQTEVVSEVLQLGQEPADGTNVNLPVENYTTTDDDDSKYGVIINPNTNLLGVTAEVGNNTSTGLTAYLQDSSGNVLKSKSFSGSSFTFDYELSAGTRYWIQVNNGGNSWTYDYETSPSFPYTSGDIDVVDGLNSNNNNGNIMAIGSVTARVKSGASSGDATISWGSLPSEITAWDLAYFKQKRDDETVTVDILDSDGNLMYEDIPYNFDISTISETENIQVRVNLSRNDKSNNPRVTEIGRRFER